MGGVLRVTVVLKATFGLVHDGPARLIAPVEIIRKDSHHDKLPSRSLEAASETAPYLPNAGVTLSGHAYAPGGRPVPAMAVRIALMREELLLDKTLHVYGDRSPSAPAHATPFQRMPILYERAFGGAGVEANPVGVGAAPGSALPNVVDPVDPSRPAGFGPISRYWQARKSLAGAGVRKKLEETVAEIADDFDWRYLQAAPLDQQLERLLADEWITLDGLHPALPRLETQLPGARALAHVHEVGPHGAGPAQVLAMVADTLTIDADRQCCSVVWRGHFPVADEAALAALKIFAGIEIGPHAVPWPEPAAVEAPAAPMLDDQTTVTRVELGQTITLGSDDARAAAERPAAPFVHAPQPAAPPPKPPAFEIDDPLTHTQMLSSDELERKRTAAPATPFQASQNAARPEPVAAPPLPGAPWSPRQPPPAPPLRDDEEHTRTLEPKRDPHSRSLEPKRDPHSRSLEPKPPAPPAPAAPYHLPPPAPPPRAGGSDAARFFHSAPRAVAGAAPADAPREREPPPRTGEVAKIVNASALTAATVPWQIRPPNDSLTVIVKGTFDLVPNGRARPRAESDLPLGDMHVDDDPEKSLAYASDFAFFKPKADVTVTGHAYAPGGSSPAMQVSFRFGAGKKGFDRTLYVLGDRQWQRSIIALAPSDPEPFQRLPLVYERAFGGPQYDANPAGVGRKAAVGADGLARLPNVELPGELVKSPGDAPPPAGFAPIPVTWKERWSKLGTYDRAWFKARWPYFPEDFDWTHFQSAPAGQQLDYLAGDEAFELVGMSPEHPSLRGELPAVRARAFVQRTKEAGGGFEEVLLRLDTAAFDADELKVNLVWRGQLEVSDEDAPEIQHVFVLAEDLAGPSASLEEARLRYLAAAIPKETVAEGPDDAEPANDVEPPVEEEPDEEAAKLEAELDAREKALAEQLRAAGLDDPDAAAPAMPPPPDPAALAASLREAGASDDEVAEVLAALRPEPDEPADADAGEVARDLRAETIARLHAGEPLGGLDLADGELHDLDFSGRDLSGTILLRANLRGSSFAGAVLAGAQLGEANLTEADFTGADLSGADLTGAVLEKAKLDRATLARADLSSARGGGATFAGAKGEHAVFAGGCWDGGMFDGAELPGADFSSASLAGASLAGASLPDVRLYDVRGARAVFDRAKMPNGRAEGASFPQGSFKEIEAPGSVWEKATLTEATFAAANLEGSSFLRATCLKTNFSSADLTEARLRRARLTGAILVKANLMMASLERADLTIADLRGANLHSAGMWKAKIQDAKLEQAIITKSTLVMRRPP